MSSIRKFLTLLLIASLILVVFSAAIRGYKSAIKVSSTLLDEELKNVASVLINVDLNETQKTILTHGIGVQIWHKNMLLLKSSNVDHQPMSKFTIGFSERNFAGARWRVFTGLNDTSQRWVMVAQPINYKFDLTETLILSAMLPFLVSIPILALVVFWGISKALTPLNQLENLVSNKDSKDLSELKLTQTPNELKAIVATLNSLLSRLNAAFEREKQFSANAAHELRTPLSVMKINLHNIAQKNGIEKDQLDRLQEDTDRMIQVVNQILLLSRTSPELFSEQLIYIDPLRISQQAISDLYSKITQKNQQIELLGESDLLLGSEFTFSALVRNLVDNASKYSPRNATIQVSLTKSETEITLCVEDNGPGISEADKSNILRRFVRTETSERHAEGSGLGLAIVGQIILLYEAKIELLSSSLGGLKVVILFPIINHKSLS
jgi:two-component system sensor histidine kinase QseC